MELWCWSPHLLQKFLICKLPPAVFMNLAPCNNDASNMTLAVHIAQKFRRWPGQTGWTSERGLPKKHLPCAEVQVQVLYPFCCPDEILIHRAPMLNAEVYDGHCRCKRSTRTLPWRNQGTWMPFLQQEARSASTLRSGGG